MLAFVLTGPLNHLGFTFTKLNKNVLSIFRFDGKRKYMFNSNALENGNYSFV